MSQEQQNNQNSDQNQNNNGGAWSDNWANNSNNNQDGDWGWEDKDKDTDKNTSVPSFRLKEEADKRRDAESQLKTANDKLAEYQEKERLEKEKELKAKWKFEEILKTREDEIATLTPFKEKTEQLESAVNAIVEQQLETIKTSIGEEKLNKILWLVWYENLDVLWKSNALPKINELVSELWGWNQQQSQNKGWNGIDPNKGKNLDEIAEKWGFNALLWAIIGWGNK